MGLYYHVPKSWQKVTAAACQPGCKVKTVSCAGASQGSAAGSPGVPRQRLERHGRQSGRHLAHRHRHLYERRSQSAHLWNLTGLPAAENTATAQVCLDAEASHVTFYIGDQLIDPHDDCHIR